MSSVKRFMLAGLFIVPVLLVQSTWAAIYLPGSSYYQGYILGGPENDVRVDFAVYDTLGGNEFADAGFDAPGDGQYTYVYQVFNDVDDFSIDLFRIFEIDIDPAAIPGDYQISSEDDQQDGIVATDAYFSPSLADPSYTSGIWEFEQDAVETGDHSWFLTISSNAPPTPGDFSLNTPPPPSDDLPVPGIPEPATMILFGIGSAILAARRKNSVGISR